MSAGLAADLAGCRHLFDQNAAMKGIEAKN